MAFTGGQNCRGSSWVFEGDIFRSPELRDDFSELNWRFFVRPLNFSKYIGWKPTRRIKVSSKTRATVGEESTRADFEVKVRRERAKIQRIPLIPPSNFLVLLFRTTLAHLTIISYW